MNETAYRAVRDGRRVAFAQIERGYIEVTGRDRLTFLQGQVSNDVADLQVGQGRRACLLNATGHLLAELHIFELGERVLIETDRERVDLVLRTLERYVIRERAVFRDISADLVTVTVQGSSAGELLAPAGLAPLPAGAIRPTFSTERIVASDNEERLSIVRDRTGAGGYDVVSPVGTAADIIDMMLYAEFANALDPQALDILRIEAWIPAWGKELDESVIPLEAEMHDAISYTKGCYVGQEIIARIHARGHVNKVLRLMSFASPVTPGAELSGRGGDRDGARIGRITSVAISPDQGPIAMGYVHIDYSEPGAAVDCGTTGGTILARPDLTRG